MIACGNPKIKLTRQGSGAMMSIRPESRGYVGAKPVQVVRTDTLFDCPKLQMTVRHERASAGQLTLQCCHFRLASGDTKPRREPPPHRSHDCETRPIWTPWGWAVDRKRLTWLIVNWCFRNRKCFTCQFRSQYHRTRREVFPILSRVQNIGYEMGENNRTPEWYRANHRTPWVAGKVGAQQFGFPPDR